MTDKAERSRVRRPSRIVVRLVLLLSLVGLCWFFAIERPARARREDAALSTLEEARDALKRGRPKTALKLVQNTPDSGRHAAGVMAVRGLAHASLQEPEAARSYLEKAIALDPPGDPMVLKVLAAVYFHDEDPDAGFEALRRAALVNPTDFRPWYAAGHFQLRLKNRPAEAVESFREALKREPGHLESGVELAEALVALGEQDEASEIVGRLRADHADDPRVLKQSAALASLSGDLEAAEKLAGRCLEFDADDFDARILRSGVRMRLGRPEEALADAERAVAVSPHSPAALVALARTETSLGLKDRAAETSARLTKVREAAELVAARRREVRKRPGDAETRRMLGQAALAAGMPELAEKSFQAARTLDAKSRPAAESVLTPRSATAAH